MTVSQPLLPNQENPSNIDRFCEWCCYSRCPNVHQCDRCVEVLESPCPDFCACWGSMTRWEHIGLTFSLKTWILPLIGEISLHDSIQCEDSKGYDLSTTRLISYIGLGYSAFIGLCSICCLVNIKNNNKIEKYKARRLLAINSISVAVTIIWNTTLIFRSNNGC